MPLATISAVAALLGGVLWILHALVGGGSDPLAATLRFVGLASVMVAAAVYGSTLVRAGATGMRVFVGVASALLVLSMVEAFRTAGSGWYYGGWGIVFALIGGLALVRGRRTTPGSAASDGPHPH